MKKKKKQGNGLLFIIAFLFLAAMIAFVGTFASYITSRTVSDGAEVAKFGLNIPAAIQLFSDSYTNVQADADGKKIIAPGTDGQYTFKVSGTAEVAYTVSADVSLVYSAEWGEYRPLEFSIDGTVWTDFEQFGEDLSEALARVVMPANAVYDDSQTIYWRWPFSVSSGNDVKDTEIGALAAAGTAANVTVTIEVTAAQVD